MIESRFRWPWLQVPRRSTPLNIHIDFAYVVYPSETILARSLNVDVGCHSQSPSNVEWLIISKVCPLINCREAIWRPPPTNYALVSRTSVGEAWSGQETSHHLFGIKKSVTISHDWLSIVSVRRILEIPVDEIICYDLSFLKCEMACNLKVTCSCSWHCVS